MTLLTCIGIALFGWALFEMFTAGAGGLKPLTPRQRERAGLKPLPLDWPGYERLSRRQRAYGEKLWREHRH